MIRNLYLLLLACIFMNACVSKKYGRHFQNHTSSRAVALHEKPMIQKEPQLVAAASSKSPGLILEAHDYTKVQISKTTATPSMGNKPSASDIRFADLPDRRSQRLKTSDRQRKLEPLGLGAFGVFIIATLMGISMGFTPMLFALIGIAMVVGVVSIYRVRANKKRLKGGFFGNFVVIAGILLLSLLGISELILSLF